jgi:hypothetical protein
LAARPRSTTARGGRSLLMALHWRYGSGMSTLPSGLDITLHEATDGCAGHPAASCPALHILLIQVFDPSPSFVSLHISCHDEALSLSLSLSLSLTHVTTPTNNSLPFSSRDKHLHMVVISEMHTWGGRSWAQGYCTSNPPFPSPPSVLRTP